MRRSIRDILTRTANALKGEPAPMTQHSWHDLAEVAAGIRADLDLERMRLSTCGAATWAINNGSFAMRLDKGHRYWSASYGAVCDAVDREMAFRAENERLREQIKGGDKAWVKP